MNTCLTGGSVDDGVLLVVVEPPPEPWLPEDGEVTVCAVWAGTVTVTVPPPEPPPPPRPEEADEEFAPAFEFAWLVCVLDIETATTSGAPVALWATEPSDEPTRAPNASMPITATAAARGCNDESRSSQSRAGVQGVSSRSRRAPIGTRAGVPIGTGVGAPIARVGTFCLSNSETAAGRAPRRAPHSTQ